ncbi:MAG: RES domain-containing protein [Bacteroidetes bacterium]|nr:MAG: RES domain-containing protein [Bacteroidota bacterium]
MEVYRISKKDRAKRLSSSGSANRWNYDGQMVIYAGSSRSLSSLELIVHSNAVKPKIEYRVMVISIDDSDHLVKQVIVSDLPNNWRLRAAYRDLQVIGANWYNRQESLILKVPSAVIPMENNFIINTEHPEYRNCVHLIRLEDSFWDERILKRF